jgi:hypothetical protein
MSFGQQIIQMFFETLKKHLEIFFFSYFGANKKNLLHFTHCVILLGDKSQIFGFLDQ